MKLGIAFVLALVSAAGAQQQTPGIAPKPADPAPQAPAASTPAPRPPVGAPPVDPASQPRPRVYGTPADPAEPLYGYSLLVVAPPKPRKYQTHDLVTIVVDESSTQQADQTLNTDKKYNNSASLNAAVDPIELLQLRLRGADTTNLKLLDVNSAAKFDGKGKFERSDRLSLKIEAEIIDVKPNGNLTLEARKVLDKNGESLTTVLSGTCRPEDITANNTVFSSQLAGLTLVTKNEGQVNDAGKKGLIPRVLETLFAF